MVSRSGILEDWLAKSWSSDFFQALQRRLPLIILSSLALVLASFSGTLSLPAVAWATGAGVAFLLAFLQSFLVQILRGTAAKASAIATVYGLTILGFLCLFVVAAEFARVSWPAGVAFRLATRYGLTLALMILFLASVPKSLALVSADRNNARAPARARLHSIVAVGIIILGTVGSVIMIVSSIADIVLGESAPASVDVLAWQTSALVLVASSVLVGELASRRWAQE